MSLATPSDLSSVSASLVQLKVPAVKRYKPSRFIAHARLEDNTTVIYNSLTGHHAAVSEQSRERLKTLLSSPGTPEPSDPLGAYLIKNHYLIQEDLDERSAWDIRYGNEQYRQDIFELILLSSEDCNFRCVYCSQEFKRGSMLPHVRNGVLDLIRGKASRISQLTISWFGGEPLVGWDAIEEMAPQIQAIARDHNVHLSSDMTTNGYLLTPERAALLLKWGVRKFQITLDGTEADHDAHRPLKDGGSTYATIIENLKALQKTQEYFSVALRVNADNSNSAQLSALFDLLSKEFGSDERFAMRFRPVGKWGGPNDDALATFCGKDEERSTLVQLQAQASVAGMHIESPMAELKTHVCYAARPYSLVVGADGKLMKCTVVLDTLDANVVGHMRENGSIHIDEPRLAAWIKPHYIADSTCQKCFFLPACQGASCPLPRLAGHRPCPPAKMQIQKTLRDVYLLETNPRALLQAAEPA